MPAEQSPFYGTQGGSSFSLYPRNNSTVKNFKVWAGLGSGKADKDIVLKGIAVEWFNGERDKIYNRPQPGDTVSEYSFEENETAIWSTRAGLRVVKIEFDTTAGQHWNAGGDTGTLYPRIANGSVIGFQGMSGWEIDHLSIRYNAK